jgi:NADPH-dependent 2,4-dienoyl-CoA reductase/sulfur reductase-like enzyme
MPSSSEQLIRDGGKKKRVVIIGAGAAGMVALYQAFNVP